jgi:hypothetical protein
MCPPRKTLFVSAASLLLLLAAGSQSDLLCQNLVANGQFDSDLTSWSNASGIGFAHWDLLDADGSPHSGSVLISNDAVPDGLDTSIDQCVSVTGGIPYFFSADLHPDNYGPVTKPASGELQPLHTGFIYVLFNFYTSRSCGGAPLNDFVALGAGVTNDWQSRSQNFTPAASVVSVLVTVSIFKQQGGGNLSAHFDNISLAPLVAPSPTPTPIPASTDTPTPTPTPTATPTRTAAPAPTETPTPAPTAHRLPRVVPFR